MSIKQFELEEIINKLELYERREGDSSGKLKYNIAIHMIKTLLLDEHESEENRKRANVS